MNPVLRIILLLIGSLSALTGLAVVYGAPKIAERRGLVEKKQIDPRIAENLSTEQLENYRRDMAALDVKLKGLMIAAPGFILLLILFA